MKYKIALAASGWLIGDGLWCVAVSTCDLELYTGAAAAMLGALIIGLFSDRLIER